MTETLDRQTGQRDEWEQAEPRYSARYDLEMKKVIVSGIKQADEGIIVSPDGGLTYYRHEWVTINEARTVMIRQGQDMYGLEVTQHFTVEGVTGLEFGIDESGSSEWMIAVQDEHAAVRVLDYVEGHFNHVYEERKLSERRLGPSLGLPDDDILR